MYVWRIEHKEDGSGPYSSKWGARRLLESFDMLGADQVRHPSPSRDSRLASEWEHLGWRESEAHIFGFASKEQMLAWFYADDCRKALADIDYVLRVYFVKGKVLQGNTQCVFKREEGTIVHEYTEF